jgi:hypothetical protein
MDSGILMIQDSILVCSPDPRIPHTADSPSGFACSRPVNLNIVSQHCLTSNGKCSSNSSTRIYFLITQALELLTSLYSSQAHYYYFYLILLAVIAAKQAVTVSLSTYHLIRLLRG